MANEKLSVKLLINAPAKHVLFAEAGKEVVDFLFSLLAMPLATIIKLLKEKNMVGCVGRLYQSLQSLEEPYLQSKQNKDALLSPTVSSTSVSSSMLLPAPEPAGALGPHYRCGHHSSPNCYQYFTAVSGTACPWCRNQMKSPATFVSGEVAPDTKDEGGCVKGVVTYTIMDDLTVSPMSSISSITLVNKFKVKDLSSLEEKVVTLGIEEGLKLLKASLQSKTVLTDVFLRGA